MIDDLHGEIQNVLDRSFRDLEKVKRDRDMVRWSARRIGSNAIT